MANLALFSQLLEEADHFCVCGQEKVAKIVHCGEQFLNELKKRPPAGDAFNNL